MNLKNVFSLKCLIISLVLFEIINLSLILLMNNFAKDYSGQCLIGKECEDYCIRGIKPELKNMSLGLGKTGENYFKFPVGLCCCTIKRTYHFYSFIISPFHIIWLYLVVLMVYYLVKKKNLNKEL